MTLMLAVDVGGTTIKAEVQAPDHTAVVARRRPTPQAGPGGDGSPILRQVAGLANELITAVRPVCGPVCAVGVCVPGLVDLTRGVGVSSVNLGWRDAPVAAYLGAALRLPITVSHDVSVAGQAELLLGAGRDASDVLFLGIGTGIAGAVLAGGSLLASGAGQVGEVGHLRVRPDGPRCLCGARGCLEAVASARAIAAAYAARTGRPVGSVADMVASLTTDVDAQGVWQDAVMALADGLLAIQTVLASDRVILGGGLAAAGSMLLDPLAAALREGATVQLVPELRLAELGDRAGVVGAGLAARAAGISR